MHLLLIRHGQSENNALEAVHGASAAFDRARLLDSALSALGERQARLLARHLGAQLRAVQGHVRLGCSSAKRALQTARPLAAELGVRPVVMPEVLEVLGFFRCTGNEGARGLGRAEIEDRYPGFDASLVPEDGQGGEDAGAALQRARALAASLRWQAALPDADEEVLIIICHNDFIGLLSRLLLVPSSTEAALDAVGFGDLFAQSYWPMNNTGISHLILGARPPTTSRTSYPSDVWLAYWNRSDHLAEKERSGVQFKNVGFLGAAEWARLGEGGSGLAPRFKEHRTVRRLPPPTWVLAVAAAALVAAALPFLRRGR